MSVSGPNKQKNRTIRPVLIIVLFILWQAIYATGVFPMALFPGPLAVLKKFIEMLLSGEMFFAALYSIVVILLSLLSALLLAGVLVFVGRKSFLAREAFKLLHDFLAPLPGIAILPLIILWSGLSLRSLFLIMIHASLWPTWLQLELAVETIEQRFGRFMRAFRLPPRTVFFKIYLPGLKRDLRRILSISWGRSWRALLSAEMVFGLVGKRSGLGWLIFERRMYMDSEGIYAGLLAVMLAGLLFEGLIFKEQGEKER